jgi:hypothetical protein
VSIINGILNTLNTLWAIVKAIPTAISALETRVVIWINTVVTDVDDAYNYAYNLAEADINYAVGLYNSLEAWAASQYLQLYDWIGNELAIYGNYALSLYNDALQYINDLYSYIDGSINEVLDYIYNNYIKPFLAELEYVLNWIEQYGAFILNLLMHPDQLALLLAHYLLGAWVSLGKQFAVPFFRWFYSTAISLIPDFEDVFEDVISALFD